MGCIEIVSILKKIYVYIRGAIRLISLTLVSAVMIVAAIVILYKPIYKVTINGETIGYCEDKESLQNKINDYMENGYHQMVLISPVRKKEFMKKIEEYRNVR